MPQFCPVIIQQISTVTSAAVQGAVTALCAPCFDLIYTVSRHYVFLITSRIGKVSNRYLRIAGACKSETITQSCRLRLQGVSTVRCQYRRTQNILIRRLIRFLLSAAVIRRSGILRIIIAVFRRFLTFFIPVDRVI